MYNQSMRSGGIRIVLVLLVVIFIGGQQTYLSLRNSSPITLTYEEYIQGTTDAEWLHLTGIQLDFSNSAEEFYEESGKLTDLYVPILSANSEEVQRVKIVLKISDKDFIRFYDNIPETSEEAADAYLDKHKSKWDINEVEGLLEFGVGSGSASHSELAGIIENIDSDFALIQHNDKPMGIGLGGAILAIGAILLFLHVRPKKKVAQRQGRKTGRTTRTRRSGNDRDERRENPEDEE